MLLQCTFVLRNIVLESDWCHLKYNDSALFFRNKVKKKISLISLISNRIRFKIVRSIIYKNQYFVLSEYEEIFT